MPIAKTDPEPESEADPNAVVPGIAYSFTNGDAPPANAIKKSISVQAIQMNMGFDCNGMSGNAGDWAVFLPSGACMVMSDL